jgi:hypothetical protein
VPPGRAAVGSGPGGYRPPLPHPAAHVAGAGATRSSSVALGGLDLPYTWPPRGSAGQSRPARAMEATRAAHGVLDRRSRIANAAPASAVAYRTAGRTAGPGLPCVDRRGLRHCGDGGLAPLVPTARPETSGRYPGHPPALWIAVTYHHRGLGASRRVPNGGADTGLSRRNWIAWSSHRASTVSPTGQSARTVARSNWAGPASGPGLVSIAARRQVGGLGWHIPGTGGTYQARGPPPLFRRWGTHRARATRKSAVRSGSERRSAVEAIG